MLENGHHHYVIHDPATGLISGWGVCPEGMLDAQVPLKAGHLKIEISSEQYHTLRGDHKKWKVVGGRLLR